MRVLPALLLLSLASCVLSRNSKNEPFSQESVARLQPGETTAREVVDLLGAPNDVVQLAGRSAYLYEHSRGKTAVLTLILITFINSDERADRIWLFFDDHDVLTHVGSTLAADRAGWALPWTDPYDHAGQDDAK